jgi:hypothetical protein
MDLTTITNALQAAQSRGALPTSLGTAELRELGEDLLGRSVFTARGSNAIFISKLDEVVQQIASGDLDNASARLSLLETLRALGYTPEGGFPDDLEGEVPPAIAGSLQDLSSFRRLDLIVRTQREMMVGKGQMIRGFEKARLALAPAFELVRVIDADVPRDWQARWQLVGGVLYEGRIIAFKGDPRWGELGSYDVFSDALGVDHPPFAFNSGMRWREVFAPEVRRLGITGPDGESIEEFFAGTVITSAGQLPPPELNLRNVRPDIAEEFAKKTGVVIDEETKTATIAARAEELKRRIRERTEAAIARSLARQQGGAQ